MQNNQAMVMRVSSIESIEGADKIEKANLFMLGVPQGQVVVGKGNFKQGDSVVFFDSNMCLSTTVLSMYPVLSTYLGKNGRVRVVKLRNTVSVGLAVEVSKFKPFLKGEEFVEGFSFTKLGDTEICHKYVVPVKVARPQGKQGKKAKKETVLIPDQFHFHIDTDQLPRNIHRIKPGQIVSVSRKIHGTSAIFGRNLVKRPLKLVEKIARLFGAKINDTIYADVVASRTVVKSIDAGEVKKAAQGSGFYKVDVWSDAAEKNFKGKLHDGETVYYEIVGYLPGSQSMIQKGYSYGCDEGDYKIAVYRITYTAPDGSVFEYGWQQVKARCAELGVPMVEEYFYGKVEDLCTEETFNDEDFRLLLLESLKFKYLEKDCPDCFDSKKKALPDEGIVLRVETNGIEVFKLKSDRFMCAESAAHEEGEDIEESA